MWGDEGVTKLLYKQDSNTAWGPINNPKTVTMQKQGIIHSLRMITQGPSLTFNGATSASAFGPYNAYTQLELLANSQQDIFRFSGIGAYIINLVKRSLERYIGPPNVSSDSPINITRFFKVFWDP